MNFAKSFAALVSIVCELFVEHLKLFPQMPNKVICRITFVKIIIICLCIEYETRTECDGKSISKI